MIKLLMFWVVLFSLFASCSTPNSRDGSCQKIHMSSLGKLNNRFNGVDSSIYNIGKKIWDNFCAKQNDFSYAGCRKYYFAGKGNWVIIGIHNPTGLEFSLIPGGSVNFKLHSCKFITEGMAGECGCISKHIQLAPFLICRTEIPQFVFKKFGGINGSTVKKDWLPVQNVDYYSAEKWCKELGFRLPTEVEWEFACKGTLTICRPVREKYFFRFPNNVGPSGVFCGKANLFGLFNMLGNVKEWCQGNYTDNVLDFPVDGNCSYSNQSLFWVTRGGCWASPSQFLNCFTRSKAGGHRDLGILGFRPVKDIN